MKVEESSWQNTVQEVLRLRRWVYYHTQDSRRSNPGFPDLIALRDDRMLVIELKTETGKPTGEQVLWLALFERIPGAECFLWRPSDWPIVQRVTL